MWAPRGSSSTPSGVEGWPIGHRKWSSSIQLIASIDQRRQQGCECCVDSSPAFVVGLGSTTVDDFARVDVHAGEDRRDAWLLEAHAR
jgi:hypothetical protein